MVLGSTPDHRWPSDVDVFYDILARNTWSLRSGAKGVKIDRHQVNPINAMLSHRSRIAIDISPSQDASMNLRVQSL
jgi:N-acyl-D-aspartate/D-glutamate deacylase